MKTILIYTSLILLVIVSGCKKDFLDKKPSSEIVVPKSLGELQSLLENHTVMNLNAGLGQISCDDYLIPSHTNYLALPDQTSKNAYIWNKEIFDGETGVLDWNSLYKAVFYANNVLTELDNNSYTDQRRRDNVKGIAHFFRAYAYFDLVAHFSKVYDPNSADKDLGIPLRESGEIDYLQKRASVQQTFDHILNDLNTAVPLLYPDVITASSNRPSRTAAFGLLSRIYLYMGNYQLAERYADSCLNRYKKLINFNTLNQTTITPFGYISEETILFAAQINKYSQLTSSSSIVQPYSIDPVLLSLYETDDLRFQIFFIKNADGTFNSKRRYTAGGTPFTGLATDEFYLIKSECLARRNEVLLAMKMLDDLLVTRFKPGKYVSPVISSKEEALDRVLLERRKELVWRGLRWLDLKRLNRDGGQITISRTLNGTIYTLLPNDPRYVFPIPPEEIAQSGIHQNIRN